MKKNEEKIDKITILIDKTGKKVTIGGNFEDRPRWNQVYKCVHKHGGIYNKKVRLFYISFKGAQKFCQDLNIALPTEIADKLRNKSNVENKLKKNIVLTINKNKFLIDKKIPSNINSSINRIKYFKQAKDIFGFKYILENNGYNVKIKGFNNIKNIGKLSLNDNIKLYNYQKECVEFFKNHKFSGIMALDMGLGKTIASLKCFEESDATSLIIITPANLMEQWRDTIIEHFNYDVPVIISSKTKPKERIEFLKTEPIIITSFDLLRNINFDIHRDFLIIDEIQKIKNWKTQRAQAVSKIVARYKLGLTGTPIENKLTELYNVVDQVSPAFYGSRNEFNKKYIREGAYGKIISYKNIEDVFKKSKNVIFRRLKENVTDDLPEITQIEQSCIMDKSESLEYNKLYREFKTANKYEKLSKLTELKIFCSSSSLKIYNKDTFSSKEKHLENLLTDELSERKTIVFTSYKSNFSKFYKIAEKNKILSLFLSGDNTEDIKKIKDLFITYPGRVVLFMTDVGQYGMDGLQEADVLINFDLPWGPSYLKQRIGRIHRVGSKHNNILIINLITKNSLDDYIIDIINSKELLASASIDGIQKYLIDKL